MPYYTLKVVELRKETDDTFTVCFKQPALKKIKYQAGQYLTLIFRINGRRYLRPYSFSSAPGVDATLDVTVKRVPGGIVSNHIIDKLKIDDMVEVMEPMGDFVLNEAELLPDTRLVLWGAGSGITPLIAIAKYALHKNIVKHVTLVYGNRNFDQTIFAGKIKELGDQYPQQFSAWHFHTKAVIDKHYPYLIQGRINPDKVLSVIQKEGDINHTINFICGPAGLKESVKKALFNLGISDGKVFSEDFEVVRNPVDFEDIITRSVLINKAGNVATVEVTKGKSVLEAGLDAMIDLSYSCQTGSCQLCKARLIKGALRTIGITKTQALTENEHLLCCSFPLSDDIEIFVD